MAEYIDIDAPIDVAVYQRNRRIQVTLRQILESNDAKYERADVRHVVRGKWILSDDLSWNTCSECGADIDVSVGLLCYVDNEEVCTYNYCPNCGADMRTEEGER